MYRLSYAQVVFWLVEIKISRTEKFKNYSVTSQSNRYYLKKSPYGLKLDHLINLPLGM